MMTFSMPASNLYAYSLCESSISILGLFLACAKACWLGFRLGLDACRSQS